MKEADFAPGTRFFADEGEPVSISPGFVGSNFFISLGDSEATLTNWVKGRPSVVPASEFARNSPPSTIRFDEFAARVARYSDAQEPMIGSNETVNWDDISDAASKMFRVWLGGGELEWAEECWGHFQKCGLAGNQTCIEETASLVRLVTLARIHEEFSGYAWDENPETPVDYFAENLKIDPLALRILAVRAQSEDLDEAGEGCELREMALIGATNAQREQIYECLCTAYGDDTMLYSRMSRTYPTADMDDSDGEEFTITSGNCQALQYV